VKWIHETRVQWVAIPLKLKVTWGEHKPSLVTDTQTQTPTVWRVTRYSPQSCDSHEGHASTGSRTHTAWVKCVRTSQTCHIHYEKQEISVSAGTLNLLNNRKSYRTSQWQVGKEICSASTGSRINATPIEHVATIFARSYENHGTLVSKINRKRMCVCIYIYIYIVIWSLKAGIVRC
jgi:hypothetical protein